MTNKFLLKTILAFIAVLLSVNAFSQIKKQFSVENFDSIVLDGASSFVLIQSDKNRVEVIMETEDVMNYIKINNKENKLVINTTGKNKDVSKLCSKLVFRIYYKAINNIFFEGAGKLTAEGIIKSNSLNVKMKGAGTITIEIKSRNFNVQMNGAGTITVVGISESSNFNLSGVGSIAADKLISQNTKAVVNGIGQIKVFADKRLEATINGIGSIYYLGSPVDKVFTKNGLGSVKPLK